jgi:hypothetical protein
MDGGGVVLESCVDATCRRSNPQLRYAASILVNSSCS